MLEMLKKLEAVQEIDAQIGSVLRKKNELPLALNAFDEEIAGHTKQYEELKKIADQFESTHKQFLGALELNEDRTKRSQERLEQIKTNQEFQALQKEVETLKKNTEVLTEKAKKVEEELNKQKAEMAKVDAIRQEIQAKRDAEMATIDGEVKTIDESLAELEKQRAGAIDGIDKRYLVMYDRIRKAKMGIGLAIALGGSCKACNMRIPPQMYNELQQGTDLLFCPSCKRILMYKDMVSPAVIAEGAHKN